MNEDNIAVKKAAELINVTPHYIRKLLREGKIKGKQDEETARWSVEKSSLESFKHTDLFTQDVELLRKEITISIKEAVEDVEEFFETDIVSYISFPGTPFSIIDPNDCILLDDLLYNIKNPHLKGTDGKKFKRITLFLHSGGGILESAIKFCDIIRQYANEYYVIVPIMAKSAATYLSLMADKLYLTSVSELGPVDPMVQSPSNPNLIVPATAIDNFLEYYRQNANKISATDNRINDLDPLIAKKLEENIDPFLIGAHKTAIKFSTQEITKALTEHAMRNEQDQNKIKKAIAEFTNKHESHSFPITYSALQEFNIGEKIKNDEQLKSIKTLMSVYQQFMTNSNVIKLIGNREENKNIQIFPLIPSQQIPTRTAL